MRKCICGCYEDDHEDSCNECPCFRFRPAPMLSPEEQYEQDCADYIRLRNMPTINNLIN